PYTGSDGTGTIVVTPIPTKITYIGDTSVTAGQTATVKFQLTDTSGNPLPAGETVTINLPFSSTPYTGTTDAHGIVTTTDTAPMHTGSYGTKETFNDTDPYTGSNGTGTIAVTPIPTTITYTGDGTVQAGQTANISYVLTDKSGNPLVGMPITVNLPFGGQATGVTGAGGVF